MCSNLTHAKRCLFVVTLLLSIPFIQACKKKPKKPIIEKKREKTHEFDIIYYRNGQGFSNKVDPSKYVFGSHNQCSTLEQDKTKIVDRNLCNKIYQAAKNLAVKEFVSKELIFAPLCYDCYCINLHISFKGKIYDVSDCGVMDYDDIVIECNKCDLKKLCVQDNINIYEQLSKRGCPIEDTSFNYFCEKYKLGKTPDGKNRSTEYYDKTCKETNEIKELIDMLFMVGNSKK